MITIRPITINDVEGFHFVLGVVAREKRYITFVDAPPFEGTRAYVLGNIDNNQPHFIVESDGKIVGWCDAPRFNRETMQHIFHLGLGLLPEFRNQGIGRKLINVVINDCVMKGAKRIELRVYEHNVNGVHLYKSLGFKEEGRLEKSVLIEGEFFTSLMMAKILP